MGIAPIPVLVANLATFYIEEADEDLLTDYGVL